MLNKDFINERQKDLSEQKERLEKELSGIATKDHGQYHPKFSNLGDLEEQNELEVEEYDESIDAEKNINKLLNDTVDALERIEKGNYGYCTNCKKEIGLERLKAYPAAELCIKCSKENE